MRVRYYFQVAETEML